MVIPEAGAAMSLPSRGAWIEIQVDGEEILVQQLVAPLAGSVDRNANGDTSVMRNNASLPSRGAWIEI